MMYRATANEFSMTCMSMEARTRRRMTGLNIPIMHALSRRLTKNLFFDPFRYSSDWFFLRVLMTGVCGNPQRHLGARSRRSAESSQAARSREPTPRDSRPPGAVASFRRRVSKRGRSSGQPAKDGSMRRARALDACPVRIYHNMGCAYGPSTW